MRLTNRTQYLVEFNLEFGVDASVVRVAHAWAGKRYCLYSLSCSKSHRFPYRSSNTATMP